MKRTLFCMKCGEEKEWETKAKNVCPHCGGRRFTTSKPATVGEALFPPNTPATIDEPAVPWDLSAGEQLFLRALKIDPT